MSYQTTSLPTCTLGKTGEKVPILGLGTGPSGMGLSDDEAIRLYQMAVDLGVTYIDTAPGYERAQSQLSRALNGRRDSVFLTTKVLTANGDEFTEGLEGNLQALGTDYVDLAYIHSVGRLDIDELLSADGSLQALLRAKERGLSRFIGITAHNRPGNAISILDTCGDLDVAMFAMNFVETHIYGFESKVLPKAREQNMGVAAMKVYGGATDMEYHQPVASAMKARGDFDHHLAFRYALSLPGVALNVIGVYSEKELKQNIEWARTFAPLTNEEKDDLGSIGRAAALKWGTRYGEV
jgi:uncharacterized protein